MNANEMAHLICVSKIDLSRAEEGAVLRALANRAVEEELPALRRLAARAKAAMDGSGLHHPEVEAAQGNGGSPVDVSRNLDMEAAMSGAPAMFFPSHSSCGRD